MLMLFVMLLTVLGPAADAASLADCAKLWLPPPPRLPRALCLCVKLGGRRRPRRLERSGLVGWHDGTERVDPCTGADRHRVVANLVLHHVAQARLVFDSRVDV